MPGHHSLSSVPMDFSVVEGLVIDAMIQGHLGNSNEDSADMLETSLRNYLGPLPDPSLLEVWTSMLTPALRAQQIGGPNFEQVDALMRQRLNPGASRTDNASASATSNLMTPPIGRDMGTTMAPPPVPPPFGAIREGDMSARAPAVSPSRRQRPSATLPCRPTPKSGVTRRRTVELADRYLGVDPQTRHIPAPPSRLPPPPPPPPPLLDSLFYPPPVRTQPAATTLDGAGARSATTRQPRMESRVRLREVNEHIPHMRLTRIIVSDPNESGGGSSAGRPLTSLSGLLSSLGADNNMMTQKMPTFAEQLRTAWTESPLVLDAYKAFMARCFSCSSGGKSEATFRIQAWLKNRPDHDPELYDVKKIRDALVDKVKFNAAFTDVVTKSPDSIVIKWDITPPAKRRRVGNMVMECKICQSAGALMAMRPCGHTVCKTCADKLKEKCPFCRERVCEFITLYAS
eukprot:GEMP01006349.1.p1 GENE.GEMP01006349.1~~GEMP01006349.1.p1  ORF type:complete len:458 (+),score=92.54 GEMP01006349.1:72-1445(+)